MPRQDKRNYDKFQQLIITRVGDSEAERRNKWWSIQPEDQELLSTWYRRVAETTTRYLKDFQSRQQVLDQLIVETFLGDLPANVAAWVRQQCDGDPEYACEDALVLPGPRLGA